MLNTPSREISNERSARTNVSSNYYIEIDSDDNMLSQEDFDNDVSDNEDSGDISSEDDLLNEDDIFTRDDILTESSVLSEDDMLPDDNVFNTDSLMSEHNVLREVVDESLYSEKMLSINGKFALYFSNITEALLFFWIQKHTTQAYNDLVNIIYNPQFNSKDVVKNIRCFRKYRQRLPLLQIKSYQIHISDKKMPSTSRDTKEAYCLSISDIIWHILNNPSLFDKMYFSLGQEVTKKI
ncbi:24650_t:CDS:2 [Racocetra persica]|uniref:24650_t:CDS:1 n=1 Tax=Racocetra persica TaxID=160502 RepID=A0ACA9LH10_9GLOM|nr:24650_t:CDS:2 [Racocetra persica]